MSTYTDTTLYVSAVVSNKAMRALLKMKFPGVKFTVRAYTGRYPSVSWVDGPTEGQVDEVISTFVGGHFDSMQDMQVHHGPTAGEKMQGSVWAALRTAYIADSKTRAKKVGHDQVAAVVDAEGKFDQAQRFSMCNNGVSTRRDYSDAAWRKVLERITEQHGITVAVDELHSPQEDAWLSDADPESVRVYNGFTWNEAGWRYLKEHAL